MEPLRTTPPPTQGNMPSVSAPSNGYVALTPRLPDTPPEPPKNEGIKSILSTLSILIAAPIVAFLLTAFVFQSYEVDGPSMETTLQNKDRLLVLKLPKTWDNLINKDYIPHRGEIIVFNAPTSADAFEKTDKQQLIKRVVGVPGDRVVVREGTVTVFNKDNPNGFNPDKAGNYADAIVVTPGNTDVVVNEGEVFVLGDNRTNSRDSRSIGTISSEDIVGELIFRVFPIGEAQAF